MLYRGSYGLLERRGTRYDTEVPTDIAWRIRGGAISTIPVEGSGGVTASHTTSGTKPIPINGNRTAVALPHTSRSDAPSPRPPSRSRRAAQPRWCTPMRQRTLTVSPADLVVVSHSARFGNTTSKSSVFLRPMNSNSHACYFVKLMLFFLDPGDLSSSGGFGASAQAGSARGSEFLSWPGGPRTGNRRICASHRVPCGVWW